MDQHHPTDRPSSSSSLSYQRIFIIIILPMDLHKYYPISGSLLIIILSMEHYHHINDVASSYRWINITLPMDYRHPINEASSLSYRRSSTIILSMEHHHHPIDGVASSSFHYRHPINEESLSYQWSINIIILSMEHYHHPIDGLPSSSYHYHYPTNASSLSYQ
ncbi:hypothetical protein KY290_017043 [Solanum tuberosum]|uniref:Uncharacterized protein n=1 Tax=Solanum tuberosum TaxID=4113 RepID=A0ABQ7VA49_SOLTU|nr:hypothetical protein KY290_017043 [Solanum tuberosum]